MSMEVLKQIREQEEQADKIKRDGLTESKRIVSTATDEATALVEKAQLEADALYRDILAKANEDSLDDYNRIINQAHSECGMLLKVAENNLDKAISVIVGKVVN